MAPVSPQWYADNEWNVTLWGTYVFTGTESNVVSPREVFFTAKGPTVMSTGDRYIEADHAWGGGGEVKYFWHRYFGFGIESFALNAKRTQFTLGRTLLPGPGFLFGRTENHRVISSVLGTLTARYPIGCSRFAPYAFAGGGAIFGGGETDLFIPKGPPFKPFNPYTKRIGSEPKAIGQFGGGLEVRVTRHVGWMTDFSWNAIDGPNNNFGMIRSGFTFAF